MRPNGSSAKAKSQASAIRVSQQPELEPRLVAHQILGPGGCPDELDPYVGDTGHGKTSIVAQMTRATVAGEPFLDWTGAGQVRALSHGLHRRITGCHRHRSGLHQLRL